MSSDPPTSKRKPPKDWHYWIRMSKKGQTSSQLQSHPDTFDPSLTASHYTTDTYPMLAGNFSTRTNDQGLLQEPDNSTPGQGARPATPSSSVTPSSPLSSHVQPTARKNNKFSSTAWATLEATLRALHWSTDICPVLKSAVGELVACLDIFEVGPFTSNGMRSNRIYVLEAGSCSTRMPTGL